MTLVVRLVKSSKSFSIFNRYVMIHFKYVISSIACLSVIYLIGYFRELSFHEPSSMTCRLCTCEISLFVSPTIKTFSPKKCLRGIACRSSRRLLCGKFVFALMIQFYTAAKLLHIALTLSIRYVRCTVLLIRSYRSFYAIYFGNDGNKQKL